MFPVVIPAKAGIQQFRHSVTNKESNGIPAFAGTTSKRGDPAELATPSLHPIRVL